ncbi:hypothetical protein EJF36_15835 [Bacillus sp. HMF5848]|uniref:DedA family protein n=1 Tax=Bacillus sp. HMF5848 TaxID=2495421 RepID=UPI000F7A2B66|nr:VTT domain-containing protein [Bacillus sp. HMF5848]RSK28239.1 hypothetical protein EJF36_15835 [Bacillus sp. HMF5848]
MDWVESVKQLEEYGLWISMFLEGSSLPFPGIAVVVSYGYFLNPSWFKLIVLAVTMSVIYSIASIIPYYLGARMEGVITRRFPKQMKKAAAFFQKYGLWSVALSRPFGVGNYISYVAGMSKVRLGPYFMLTFLGILPWSATILWIGRTFHGNLGEAKVFFMSNTDVAYYALGMSIALGLLLVIYKQTTKQQMSR